jgi:hypothetical protein
MSLSQHSTSHDAKGYLVRGEGCDGGGGGARGRRWRCIFIAAASPRMGDRRGSAPPPPTCAPAWRHLNPRVAPPGTCVGSTRAISGGAQCAPQCAAARTQCFSTRASTHRSSCSTVLRSRRLRSQRVTAGEGRASVRGFAWGHASHACDGGHAAMCAYNDISLPLRLLHSWMRSSSSSSSSSVYSSLSRISSTGDGCGGCGGACMRACEHRCVRAALYYLLARSLACSRSLARTWRARTEAQG